MTKTLTRTITAALLIAALAVPAAAATTTDIGVEKAKEAALSHAPHCKARLGRWRAHL